MPYYDDFLISNKTPVDSWKQQSQEFLNETFINSSDLMMIGEEESFGSLEFTDIEARVTTTLDSKVGDKINDDYRTIFFPNISTKPLLGARFSFCNNIWIVYNTDNVNNLLSSCYVRRCNNTINIQDKYGVIHEEPCIIDIKPTKSSFEEGQEMWVPSSRQIIMYQKNEWTAPLFINSRIMYENQVFRIGTILNFNRTHTLDRDSITFVTAYLENDLKNEFDNFELQVADYKMPNYCIKINRTGGLAFGQTGNLTAEVTLNNVPVIEEVEWLSSSESVKINNGSYIITGEQSETVTITAKLKGNDIYVATTEIAINSSIEPEISVIVEPNNDFYIPLSQSKTYSFYESVQGEKTIVPLTFALSGVDETEYDYVIADNNITITNKQQDVEHLLCVSVTSNESQAERKIFIELGGIF